MRMHLIQVTTIVPQNTLLAIRRRDPTPHHRPFTSVKELEFVKVPTIEKIGVRYDFRIAICHQQVETEIRSEELLVIVDYTTDKCILNKDMGSVRRMASHTSDMAWSKFKLGWFPISSARASPVTDVLRFRPPQDKTCSQSTGAFDAYMVGAPTSI
ncbi:uncharacterized protein BDW43DRAFT_308228 [Aspergillus alliaceus]|uniref:uncharacterized protein n=1 Tax=Petromyces alliaceus TaxID=209559 RepID=UPI0012A410E7|nr:uncharacterized protein BDW43DRAFT_308228 [Aspergillus alliaceus]KAB8236551.1 hypothetical protein BDW43DRAFT_308228 [Aspergillus alliaceus]